MSQRTTFESLDQMWPPPIHKSNPSDEMDVEHIRPRHPTIAGILFCCFHGADDERSLLRTSWFHKVKRSNPGADPSDGDPDNWWRKGWNSVRRAGEWSESIVEDAGGCCNGPKLKNFARRVKNDGKTICTSRPSRFGYDPLSYELNFDQGARQIEDHEKQGMPLNALKPGESQGNHE